MILDQLDIGPVPVPEPPKVPTPQVYNPVEQAMQPGEPPKVAVKNWTWAINNLPDQTLSSVDLSDPNLIQNAVHNQHGALVLEGEHTYLLKTGRQNASTTGS